MLLDEYADLWCPRCGTTGNIYEWRFDCGNHLGNDSWRRVDLETMLAILACSVDIQNRMGMNWLRTLIVHLNQ